MGRSGAVFWCGQCFYGWLLARARKMLRDVPAPWRRHRRREVARPAQGAEHLAGTGWMSCPQRRASPRFHPIRAAPRDCVPKKAGGHDSRSSRTARAGRTADQESSQGSAGIGCYLGSATFPAVPSFTGTAGAPTG
eukprot:6159751-Pyramimonas_sp.AAC.1